MHRVPVQFPPAAASGYSIIIEPGLLAGVGPRLAELFRTRRAVVITDSNVRPLLGNTVLSSLADAGIEPLPLEFPAGEPNKTLASVSALWDRLADLPVERSTPVVALGGGVVGDVAGFVAACYLRGLPVVQVPTTLLAMVDSSVGGKTGVDHPVAGKNMIGAFHQPNAVFIDPLTLATLPQREWSCGFAESVKHGAVLDADFFAWIESHADALARIAASAATRVPADANLLEELVVANCRVKAAVVSGDAREAGLRAVLNFGHTIGHAIETLAGLDRLRHGEAVAIGLAAEARIAAARGLLSAADLSRLVDLMTRLSLPLEVPADIAADDIRRMMTRDKKVQAGKVRFVLPAGVGKFKIVDDVTNVEIDRAVTR